MQYFILKIIFYSVFLISVFSAKAQQKKYAIITIAFYNLENLFDYEDDPITFDEDYLPDGKNLWNEKKFNKKLENLATVIFQIGHKLTGNAPVILGVAEVENRFVLEKLTEQPQLKNANYGIAHFNSPDRRGIDVGLLYNRDQFQLENTRKHRLDLKDETGKPIYTRDQLCVSGYLGEELFYFIINHWPSRRGGEKRSEPKRIEAAKLTKKITDSIHTKTKDPNIVIMGDFNDDPNNKSFKKILSTKSNILNNYNYPYLYNPFEKMHKLGIGSLAYRDKWNLFDQIIVSNSLLDSIGFKLYKTNIYKPKFLTNTKGKYKGYPLRTFSGGKYNAGYSDHFPAYIYLVKKI